MQNREQIAEKRYFDEKDIPEPVWDVLRAASLLSVGEFKVFEIAYSQWHGKKGDEKTIERYYIPYMFNDMVPFWVRHFCQKVIALDHEGRLDPAEFGITQRFASPEDLKKGLDYIVLLVVVMTAFFLIGTNAAKHMELPCMFPPCY